MRDAVAPVAKRDGEVLGGKVRGAVIAGGRWLLPARGATVKRECVEL